jgi:hypothetical protein
MLNPLDHPVCLDRPVWLQRSAWTEHIPFAMYLVSALRPRRFVELGTYHGVSYCAFCQAARSLALDAEFFAVDTWEGDEHAGRVNRSIFESLQAHHDPLYGGFSKLLKKPFEAAVHQFVDGSIDLLHIDGLHTYEASKNDFETWLPKMSDRGIVLFHDVCEKRDDFGVWKLWDEVSGEYDSFLFTHEHGLGVLAVGNVLPNDFRALFEVTGDEAESIRKLFQRLGSGIRAVSEHEAQLEYMELLKTHESTVLSSPTMRLYRVLRYEGFGGLLRKLRRRMADDQGSLIRDKPTKTNE